MNPYISIIVPVYNAVRHLRQCMDSLINQTLEHIEIICVNDGSTDDSLNILEEYSNQDERIRVVNRINAGVSTARNIGMELVEGQYFMFVDSDDWLDVDACKKMYDEAMKYSLDCVMCTYSKVFNDHIEKNNTFDKSFLLLKQDEVKEKIYRRLFGPLGEELQSPDRVDILVSSWGQLFLSEKFRSIRFTDINEIGTFEDGLFQMDIYKDCASFGYINQQLYNYRKNNIASITSKYNKKLYEKWNILYTIIEQKIINQSNALIYNEALQNRIAIGILGLGLNETHSDKTISQKAKMICEILKDSRYAQALEQLDTSNMPFHWKVFYSFCKLNASYFIVIMLECIEYFRKKAK